MNEKERYCKLKSEHRCVSCGNQDEKTLSGSVCCAECKARRIQMRKNIKEKQREKEKVRKDMPNQSTSLLQHIKEANALGISYGTYMSKLEGKNGRTD